MKNLVLVFGLFSLVSTAHAEVSTLGHEMQTFMRCSPAHIIMDAGMEIELRQERVGSYADAVVTSTSLFGVRNQVYNDVKSRPEITQGDIVSGTIYTAHKAGREFELIVDFGHRHGDASPAVLELGGIKRDMLCQRFVVLF